MTELKKYDNVKVKGFYEKDYPFGGIILGTSASENFLFYKVYIIKKTLFGKFKPSSKYHLFVKNELELLK